MNSYQDRKLKEIQFLKQFSEDVESLDKKEIITKLKQEEIKKKNISISNMSEEKFCFGKNVLDYTYLRFKHEYLIYNEEKLVGLNYNKDWHHISLYFNSGMSAISALIESISSIGETGIKYTDQIYFETFKLLQYLRFKKHRYYFAYLDSIDPAFNLEIMYKYISDKKCMGIIVDTTCLTEIKIENLVTQCVEQNKLVFFVKSFTKLDMLATEYSRIGCLTIITSKQLTVHSAQLYRKLYVNIKQRCINYNCCPSPIDFPPFWDENEFFKLNNIRIKKIKENTVIAYDYLKDSSKFSIVKPNHQLFLLIFPNKNYSRDDLIQVCKEITARIERDYYIKYCGSFGFDFIALDTYINISDNKETIRLSLNDYDDKMIRDFSKKFLEVLNDCL